MQSYIDFVTAGGGEASSPALSPSSPVVSAAAVAASPGGGVPFGCEVRGVQKHTVKNQYEFFFARWYEYEVQLIF